MNPGENCPGCANKAEPIGGGGNRLMAFKPLGEHGPTVYRDMTGIAPEHMARLGEQANLQDVYLLQYLNKPLGGKLMYGETGGPVIIGPRGEIIRESEEVAKARDEARREEERARDEAARLAALERRSRKIANNPARVLELAATKALCELRCLQNKNAADESALEDYTVALRQAGAQAAGGA